MAGKTREMEDKIGQLAGKQEKEAVKCGQSAGKVQSQSKWEKFLGEKLFPVGRKEPNPA